MEVTRNNIAAVIINREKKVLLCKRSKRKEIYPGVWHMPGGGIKGDESVSECITRELKEELGLEVIEVGPNTRVFDEYVIDDGIHHVDFVPVCTKGEIVLDEENDEYKWVGISELDDYITPRTLELNKDAFKKALELGMYSDVEN